MKRLPYPKISVQKGQEYWRSLRELEHTPEFEDALLREFPDGAAEPPDGVSRRDFFRVMGASMALAGLAGCRRPDEKILPYSRQPEEVVPGVPLFFATAMAWNGTAIGLLVESHEGRPTKIEGNPNHPESLGATNAWAQAEVLNLYDPDRSSAPSEKGQERSWEDAAAALRGLGEKHRATGGKGLAVLTDAHRSPTTKRLLDDLKKQLPGAQLYRYDPFARDNAREGARLMFGQRLEPVLRPERAKVIVAIDCDFLMNDGGSDVRHTKKFAAARRASQQSTNRLYAIESSFTVTGAMADHRLRLTSREVTSFSIALAHELGAGRTLAKPQLSERASFLLRAIVNDLRENAGQAAIVVGEKQPALVHAIMGHANLARNNLAADRGAVQYFPAFEDATEGAASLVALAGAIKDKSVTSLVILGGNPAFNAPSDLGFAELLAGLETSVHLSLQRDETSAATTWHLNRAHFLESWSDVRSIDGTTSIVQPLIAPLFDGKTDAEVLAILLGAPARAYDLVQKTHVATPGADAEQGWRRALHDGLIPQSALAPVNVSLGSPQGIDDLAREALAPLGGIEATFVPDPHAWDGRFANNPWMQELPDPMTKLTWGNAALVSPATAKQLGIDDGDLITVTGQGGKVTVPTLVMMGQADGSITLTVGQGRTKAGRVGNGVGANTGLLRTAKAFHIAPVQVAKAGGKEELARTQEHFTMENRHVVREGSLSLYASDPQFAKKMVEPHPPLRSLYDDKDYSKVQKWALSIDLTSCTGCSACVVACVSENNIPVVGKRGVLLSREMQWIRIDRYFKGTREEPTSVTQPMTCQQCENAPCEAVCPVAATTHSPEGLNDMAYNRCIGTKYCLNNCPFKVRRFNYFHYQKDVPQMHRAQFNPDVTVRSRGVMEKCTYCVQRIKGAKIHAHTKGEDRVADGAIKTACQQVCPADAITFGDLNDPKSTVAKLKDEPRSYVLLEELNIRPRTTYLAKLTNPNPEIA